MRISIDLLLTVTILLTGCQGVYHEAHNGTDKWERDVAMTFGGTTHTTGADGWANSTDHNASFQVATQAAGGAYAAGRAAATQVSNNTKDASINASNNKLTGLQGAQKPTILTNTAPDGTVTQTAVFPPSH